MTTNGSIQAPSPSRAKPIISRTNSLKLHFGNYFSKSPKLTTNRIGSGKKSPQKGGDGKNEDNPSNGRIVSNFAAPKVQSSADDGDGNISNSSETMKQISDSTPNSHSNSSDSERNPIFFANDASHHPLPPINDSRQSVNSRYRELMKEYVDNESTISSSDIQDDLSSVASDEPSNSLKRPRRMAPPPPRRMAPPPPHPHHQSQSLTTSLSQALQSHDIGVSQDMSSLGISLRRSRNIKSKYNSRQHSKSAFSTPNDSEEEHSSHSQQSQPIQMESGDRNNPYLDSDLNGVSSQEHKANDVVASSPTISGLPPPPLSPNNSIVHHHGGHHNIQRRGSLHNYRARAGSLPPYDPYSSNLQMSTSDPSKLETRSIPKNGLTKTKSVDVESAHFLRAKSHGRAGTVDMTRRPAHTASNRLHQRANSARTAQDLTISEKLYQNRRTVLHRLSRGKSKKDVMSKLDISIGKVEEKLKLFVRNLVSLQDELVKINQDMNLQVAEWENRKNFDLTNLCRSYYSNYGLLIQIRIEIATKYCECFRDKYRQLKKTRDRIKKDAKKYSLDDLVLTVEAAMMTASNIRLPSDINTKRGNEKALSSVIKELKRKYEDKKHEDTILPMSSEDRTKHILTMLVQIIDTSNKTTMTKNVSDGLPYFHPKDNGYQVPFEQLLYDPRFDQKRNIDEFAAKYTDSTEGGDVNRKSVDRDNLSLRNISTFVYRLTNSFLDSCELNKDSPFFQRLFWDCTNLMIGRSIFPKFGGCIKYIVSKHADSVELDAKYRRQLTWMAALNQKQIGIEPEFTYHYTSKIKALKPKLSLIKPKEKRKQAIFNEMDNDEKIAYFAPINRLRQLPGISVPQDSIVLVIDTIHDIQKCATKYSRLNQQQSADGVVISGDSLFPIVVYCLIQSDVDEWNRWIFMMRAFYAEKILSFGQTGFCFSLVNAAVTYILDCCPSNFGLDDDLQ